ncbi:MAG: beta-ketoacyl synthase N-terminal-like domain-containing protein [Candidatus Aminicenantes bacterium]|nr:beta-ketoacyl synthase N-terminal-like domain-containing protein [Candidatus Aminicenantes bacterium]
MSKQANLTGFEIAIIGMAGRFPGAKNVGEFWENLVNGKESISFFTDGELLEAGVDPSELKNPNYVKANGFLEGIEYFDSLFFGYTDSEAALMDPQVRIFLECTWNGLEDAGYAPNTYNGLIGLFAGASDHFEWEAMGLFSRECNKLGQTAAKVLTNKDFLSGWVAYKLDLKGPSFTLSTACSTSLVAVHAACQAILNGECDMSIAGGVSATIFNKSGYLTQEGLPYSSDGHVRAFDAGPYGIVGGNGAAVVVLKRLEDAIKDRDHIYALIKGSAINNDGITKAGFTTPGIEGQARVIKAALEMAEVDPETVEYIEAHGTATELGDPVEIQALKLAFNTDKRQYCRIGSVKTNIGHLDAAAGAAGLVKAALCIYHGIIPASLNYKRPNPKIDFENTPFYVNAKLSGWKNEITPLRAGVSSFGIGGTNAHVILEEAPPAPPPSQSRPFQLLLLSAKTGDALDRNTQNLALHLGKNPDINLADAAYTLQAGRKACQYRRMLVCENPGQALRLLTLPERENLETHMTGREKRSLVFVFSGQGSQYVNMGLDLYNREPRFREEMDRAFHILESLCEVNIKEILYPSPGGVPGTKQEIAQYGGPITLIFEYSLARLLMKWGLTPQAMIGYSFGEYTAACLAGVFSLEDALKLSLRRGRMMLNMPVGSMMSVPLPEEELKHLLNGDIDIAAVNGPAFCIVSGPPAPIKQLRKELKEKGHECYRFLLYRAGHSRMMVPFKEEFVNHFEGIRLDTPKIPYISGLTGDWITRQQATSPGYWARHMTETIRFSDGIGRLLQELNPLFAQVGADRGLPLYIGMHPLKGEENPALNLVRYTKEEGNDVGFLLDKIGRLWLFGANVDWEGFYAHEKRGRIALPPYSFERTSYPPLGDLRKIIAGLMAGKDMDTLLPSPRQGEGAAAKIDNADSPPVQHKRKRPKLKAEYVPPTDDMEQKLVDIFQSFFGIEPVGIYDDFYELGGDSIRAVQLIGLIKKTYGINASIQQFLFYQNIHDICAGLRKESGIDMMENAVEPSPPVSEEDKPALKDEVSPEEQALMEKEVEEVQRLSDLLKMNKQSRIYEVSPVQAAWLLPPFDEVSTQFAYNFYDFTYPMDEEKIRGFVEKLTQRNSLLRSVIINKKRSYFIEEYDSFSNIRLPFIDISSYSAACREKIIEQLIRYFNKPMEVLDKVLFRACLLRLDHTHLRLFLQVNHLIGDGACVGILDKQLYAVKHGLEEPRAPITDYYDYVRFMKEQNYDHIGLDKYLNFGDYSRTNKAILKKYKMANTKYESFEVDISNIDEKFKGYYNEIAFLTFAKSIGDLFGVDKAPIEYVTNGRIYKDGDFNHVLGDFHDTIPVLLSLHEDPKSVIDGFIDYKRFIKENKLNFTNYASKGYIAGSVFKNLRSPFSFNAIIGSSDFFKSPLHEERLATIKYSSPHVGMFLLEDFAAEKLWISFIQNSGFAIKEIFMKNFSQIVDCLNKTDNVNAD